MPIVQHLGVLTVIVPPPGCTGTGGGGESGAAVLVDPATGVLFCLTVGDNWFYVEGLEITNKLSFDALTADGGADFEAANPTCELTVWAPLPEVGMTDITSGFTNTDGTWTTGTSYAPDGTVAYIKVNLPAEPRVPLWLAYEIIPN